MTRTIVFRHRANVDIEEAAEWYNERGSRLGLDFVRMVDQAVSEITALPFRYRKIREEVRQAPLQKFPYWLVYEVTEDEIIILRCRHFRRNPEPG